MSATWPELAAVELLVAVADHGSLSAGARAIGMAQPNATRSIARLERRLGLPLLHRSTTGSTITPAGLLVVEWSRTLIGSARAMLDGASGLAVDGAAELTVAASQTIAEQLLPRWLATFRTRHARTVTVLVENSTAVLDRLRHGGCDLGFVEGPHAPKDLPHVVVARDELVLVAAPDHPWARRRTPVTTAELAGTGLVTREQGSGTRTALEDALAQPVAEVLALPSNAAVRVAVQAGTAPAVLSRHAVADALAAGTLIEVAAADLPVTRSLRAVWAGPRRSPALVAELVAIARHDARPGPSGGIPTARAK